VLVPGTAKNGADLVREELAMKLVPTLSVAALTAVTFILLGSLAFTRVPVVMFDAFAANVVALVKAVAALPVIIPRTSTPPMESVLAVNVRLDVALPVLKKLVLTIDAPRAIAVVFKTTEPTVTFEEKVAELEMVLLTYISAK
jgi:hypothetical protein